MKQLFSFCADIIITAMLLTLLLCFEMIRQCFFFVVPHRKENGYEIF